MSGPIDFKTILDSLHRFESRQIGKTYAAATLAKKAGGILVTFSHESARQLAAKHGVETRSIQSMEWANGCRRPIIFDQDAFTMVLHRAIELEEEVKALKEVT